MQIKSKHLLTMFVMAGISTAAISAKAATFAQGDLLLAFNQTSGSGANTVLTINLGQASQFTTAKANGTNLSNIASLGTALGIYGTSGSPVATPTMLNSTDSTVFWTVAGANTSGSTIGSDTNKTVYFTQAQDGNTINKFGQVTSTFSSGVSTRSTYATKIGADQTTYANTAGTDPVSVPIGNTAWVTDASGKWGNPSLPVSVQGSFAAGPSGTALDLYRILGAASGTNTSQYVGTFSIDSTGSVSFNTTAAAVPEPSRALFAALGLGALLLRRRRVNA